jgi:predicted NBD/HSP70 family sugar kinase
VTRPYTQPHTGPSPGPFAGQRPGPPAGPRSGAYAEPSDGSCSGPQSDPYAGPGPGPRLGPHPGPRPGLGARSATPALRSVPQETALSPSATRPPGGGVTHEQVRRRNLSAVLRRIHATGPLSRTRLAQATGLNRSTIASLVTGLAAAGLVREEVPSVHRAAGRPSPVVSPRPHSAQVIALEVGVGRVRAERVGLGGAVLEHRTIVTGSDGPPAFDDTARQVADVTEALVEAAEQDGRCVAVGVAVPGLVRPADGVVRFAANLGWSDLPLAAALTARLGPRARGVPLNVANDADMGALAEHTRGAARGYDDFVYVAGNVGIGGGLFCGGRPMPGHRGYAGEIGHMIVNPGGRRCRCGARGCWETEIGTDAVIRAAGLDVPADHSVSLVVEAARAGDHRAARALDDAARWMAVGLANLANILNPGLVIFGGDLHEVYAATIDQVRVYAMESGLARVRDPDSYRVSEFGMRAPLVGAAELAFTALLDDPLHLAPAS